MVDHQDKAKCPEASSPLLQPCKDKDNAGSSIQRGNGRQEPGEMPTLHHATPPTKTTPGGHFSSTMVRWLTTKTRPSAPRPAPRCFNHARTRTTQGHASRGATVDKNRAKCQRYITPHPQQKAPQGVTFHPRWWMVDHQDKAKCPEASSPLLQPCKDKDYARSRVQRGSGRQEPGEMPMLHHATPPTKTTPGGHFSSTMDDC